MVILCLKTLFMAFLLVLDIPERVLFFFFFRPKTCPLVLIPTLCTLGLYIYPFLFLVFSSQFSILCGIFCFVSYTHSLSISLLSLPLFPFLHDMTKRADKIELVR